MNSVRDKLQEEMLVAWRNKTAESKIEKNMISQLLAKYDNELIGNKEANEQETLERVAIKMEKELKEELQMCRPDRAKEVSLQLEYITRYLPKQMSEEELEAIVNQEIEEAGAVSMALIGKLKKKYGNSLDMKVVTKLIKSKM